jgi:small subunit ribosomal protein S5
MNEQVTTTSSNQTAPDQNQSSARGAGRDNRSRRGGGGANTGRGPRRGGSRYEEKPADEFEQRIVDIARVTRVMAGGKRMRFRACVAIGDKKGKVAIGLAKGADVTLAVAKAVNQAKKEMVTVPMVNQTIPHSVDQWFGAAHVLLKPAAVGRGIIGGGIVRTILELTGVNNVTSKILGTNNKVNNAKCVIEALKSLRAPKKQPLADRKVQEVKSEVKEDK